MPNAGPPTTAAPSRLLIMLVAQNLVPVAGVIFLGWSASNLIILYSVDTALAFSGVFFLAMIFASFDRDTAQPRLLHGPIAWLRAMAGVLVFALLFAIPFGIPIGIVLVALGWSPADAMADHAFQRGVLMQVAFSMTGFVQAYRALGEQVASHRNVNLILRRRAAFVFARWGAMLGVVFFGMSFVQGWLQGGTGQKIAGVIILLVYVSATIYFEMFPGRALEWLDSGRDAPGDSPAPGRKTGTRKLNVSQTAETSVAASKPVFYFKVTNNISIPPWLPIVVGAFLLLVGAASAWQELALSNSGFRATGHVIDFVIGEGKGTVVNADVQLDGPAVSGLGASPPVHIHNAFSWHHWEKGLSLNLICMHRPDATHCRIADWTDRWLPPLSGLLLGVALLFWGRRLALRRRA